MAGHISEENSISDLVINHIEYSFWILWIGNIHLKEISQLETYQQSGKTWIVYQTCLVLFYQLTECWIVLRYHKRQKACVFTTNRRWELNKQQSVFGQSLVALVTGSGTHQQNKTSIARENLSKISSYWFSLLHYINIPHLQITVNIYATLDLNIFTLLWHVKPINYPRTI